MEFREATHEDADEIASVAHASLSESYGHFIDEDTIERVVEKWYAEDRVSDLIGDEDVVLEVAEEDDAVVAFAQGATVQSDPVRGEIHWLHVDPSARGGGIGVQLLGRVQEQFKDQGAEAIRGLVLEGNESGVSFYEDHGFERAGSSEVDIGGETVTELVLERAIGDSADEQVVEAVAGPDDRELFVNFSDAERGLRAPFYAVYVARDLQDRYGWFCGDCESLDNDMDTMGRIVCNNCGNKRKATRWDGSYL